MMPDDATMMAFGSLMRQILRKNDWKYSYLRESLGQLTKRLHEEAHELSRAIQKKKSVEEICKEAADVANFALMIFDYVRQCPPLHSPIVENNRQPELRSAGPEPPGKQVMTPFSGRGPGGGGG